jgi:glycosyltransferase involved in cell wall biosynthesis/4-hydroxybenzoate polyprenyltransferase
VRAGEWWAYKIPPLLIVGFAGLLQFEADHAAWTRGATALAAVVLVAMYGYLLNDLCDIEADRKSRRPNRMADVGPVGRLAGIALPAAGALLLALTTADPLVIVLVAINLLLPTLYSVPPVRLKGRGSWGALADAAGVHAVPAAIMARAIVGDPILAGAARAHLFVGAAVGWALLVGLRGILLHQVADRASDERAGVMTLGRRLGATRARRLVLFGLFPAELACLALLLGPLLRSAPAATALIVLGLVVDTLRRYRGWTLPLFEPTATSHERFIPILSNELYEVWLPVGLALQVAVNTPALAWVPLVVIALFWRNIHARLRDVSRLLPAADERPAAERAGQTGRAQRPNPRIILAATSWTVNGVNVFSANLARGLCEVGASAEVLLTEETTDLVAGRERPMPRPAGVPFTNLPTDPLGGWGDHWGSMVRYLEDAAPCVYVPNSDWRHSSVCPQLSDRVVVVGVVHSDDPLHYDHVRRLGPYWNAVVAVSRAVAERALAVCPSIEARLVTIPIGVRIPSTPPARVGGPGPLRVVYHGILKQHQKRVLDLPRIAQAAVDRGVSIELTIAGAGPDEAALRRAAQPLVERGIVTFAGVLSPDDMPALLEAHDVYLLASEFEGMPNALIEAMGRGCVPVVSRMTSGIPELVQDGTNGLLAPVGDAGAFAAALDHLWRAPDVRAALSARAYHTVATGRFRVEDMVAAYRMVFDRAVADARAGRFIRPRAPLSHPPREVAGVSLFPVELPHVEPEIGAFPSAGDAEDYRRQTMRRSVVGRPKLDTFGLSLEGVPVFVSAPVWTSNGINHLAEDLIRGLRGAGMDARLLLTEEATRLVQIDEPRMARPADIPVEELRVTEPENWGARWGALVETLETAAPCIYLPGYDWRHACVSPALSRRVVVVGALHDGDDKYVEQAARLGASLNSVVATGRLGARELRTQVPALADRIRLIAHGLAVPGARPARPETARGPRRALLVALDSAEGLHETWAAAVAGQLGGVVGWDVVAVDPSGLAESRLSRAGVRIRRHLNRQEWLEECQTADFVIAPVLTPDTRRTVVEAMGQGCVPIVAAQADPLFEIDSATGLLGDSVDPGATVAQVTALGADLERRTAMSGAAHAVARGAGFHTDRMIAAYLDLFRECFAASAAGQYRRPRGTVAPPPAAVGGTDIFPVPLTFSNRDGRFPSRDDAERYREARRSVTTAGNVVAGAHRA